ncbi:MAG: ParB/RepB/Spo0J family partition protein [Candidatus Falkowbacteria bacterium]
MNSGLGRGLSSLIPQKVNKITETKKGDAVVDIVSDNDKNRILHVSPEKIKPNPMQPRKEFSHRHLEELVESIKQYGIIQPLIVTAKNGEYELIAGERRLRASKIAGLKEVPVIVRKFDEHEKLEVALIENIQRQDLNAIEEALAYRKLIDEFNLSQDEMGRRVGKSRPVITNSLRLLNLPEEIQQALIDGKISSSNAKLIVGLDTIEKQMALFKKIVRNNLTFDEAMKESRRMGGTKDARIKINYADKDKEFALREFFGAKVEIKRMGKGGRIIMEFYSDEELEEMIRKVRNN